MAKKNGSKPRRRERMELDQTMTSSEAAGYLEAIAKGLRDGVVYFENDAGGFSFAVNGSVAVELEARQGKRKSRIELTMAFRSQRKEDPSDDGKDEKPPANTIPDEMSF